MRWLRNHPLWLLAVQLLSFWPVWVWYVRRSLDHSGEPWHILALFTALWFSIRPAETVPRAPRLSLPASLTALYAASFPFVPAIVSALLALLAVGCLVSEARYGRVLHPGIVGLLLLAAPVIPSMQFFLGFPLRSIASHAAAWLLGIGGQQVIAEGTLLRYGPQLVEVDAPCSGVRMLWTGLYLTLVLTCFFRLRCWPAVMAAAGAIVIIVFGNVIRATALFYLETGAAPHLWLESDWLHSGIGAVAFAMTSLLILWQTWRISERTI